MSNSKTNLIFIIPLKVKQNLNSTKQLLQTGIVRNQVVISTQLKFKRSLWYVYPVSHHLYIVVDEAWQWISRKNEIYLLQHRFKLNLFVNTWTNYCLQFEPMLFMDLVLANASSVNQDHNENKQHYIREFDVSNQMYLLQYPILQGHFTFRHQFSYKLPGNF